MNVRYLSGAILVLPLLPLMYYQGKKIRARVPKLPEAEGLTGHCKIPGNIGTPLKILSIGESTIAGVGVKTHEEGFTGTFAREISTLFNLNVDWNVYARSGYTAKRVRYKIVPKIIDTSADLIIIGLGGNDAFTLNRPSKWKNELDGLIVSIKMKFPKALIVFCNMPPIKEFPAFTPLIKFTVGNLVEILGEEVKKVVAKHENTYYFREKITLNGWIDKFQLKKKKEDFFSDGVHPSKLTYQTWAKDIAREIHRNTKTNGALRHFQ